MGAGGSKLAFLGFADITCSLRRFTFTEEFAVIEGMVLDMLLGIRWEHKFNIHTGWTRRGNHYISIGKNNFVAESTNKLNVHLIIKTKGKVTLKPESILFIEVQTPRDISGNKKYYLNSNAYLSNGIIPLDPRDSFEKIPRTLQLPFLSMSTNYESLPKGSLLGTFEPVGMFCIIFSISATGFSLSGINTGYISFSLGKVFCICRLALAID